MTFGHEFTGVAERVGDDVLVPFNIACGRCVFCQQELYANCHESNPEATAVGGIFGYSHTAGGYDGGRAEYVRVPFADVGPTKIPGWMDPDDAVLLTDVVPTGYQAAEMGGIRKGGTVMVFGAGPVGIMAARCAWLFGAGRVIVIDCVDYRAGARPQVRPVRGVRLPLARRPGSVRPADHRLAGGGRVHRHRGFRSSTCRTPTGCSPSSWTGASSRCSCRRRPGNN